MAKSTTADKPGSSSQTGFQLLASLLDAVDRPLIVSDRTGTPLFINLHAQDLLLSRGVDTTTDPNLFRDLLHVDRKKILSQLESGQQEVYLSLRAIEGKRRVRLRWLPEQNWLACFIEPPILEPAADETDMRQKVQDLIQERLQITYRNVWPPIYAFRKPIARKTVFLASAAHELKTPLAVMKGLLRTSAFAARWKTQQKTTRNPARIKGKLRSPGAAGLDVPELFGARERQTGSAVPRKRSARLRQRSGRAMEGRVSTCGRSSRRSVDSTLPLFRLNSESAAVCIIRLVDSSTCYTPAGGRVTLRAVPHFWERRLAQSPRPRNAAAAVASVPIAS